MTPPTETAPATKGYVRQVAIVGMLLMGVLVGGAAMKGQVDGINAFRDACERGNAARISELHQREDLLTNAQERVVASNSTAEREASKLAVERAQQRIDELVASVETVAVERGTTTVDCEEAYPLPWPANWLD